MLIPHALKCLTGLRKSINDYYHFPEESCLRMLIEQALIPQKQLSQIQKKAQFLTLTIRERRLKSTGIDSFLTEYALSSDEGIALMCLAEALLRIPDDATIDRLIKDQLTRVDWQAHQIQNPSLLIKMTTWALILTGTVLEPEKASSIWTKSLLNILNRGGARFIRQAVNQGMRLMSQQFVMGQTIEEALVHAQKKERQGYRYSYDMLGEAALTAEDAMKYLNAYMHAIAAIGKATDPGLTIYQKPGVSVKLSALHPRYQEQQRARVVRELAPALLKLAQQAKYYDIALMIDAEESERLDISLDIIEIVLSHASLTGWNGFGLVVQAYQKRAFYLLDWIADLARGLDRRIMVRLVKGAYWDSEIKKTQMQGLSDYSVFTYKAYTDVSFQACVKKLLTMTDVIYPQFATHNAYSVAMILALAGSYRDFEFQCLYGMGKELYNQIVPIDCENIPCRVYAPVGSYEDLLPYLVRRLLENGANSSFINRIADVQIPVDALIVDPLAKAEALLARTQQNIPLPSHIFLPERLNSRGFDWTDRDFIRSFQQQLLEQKFYWRNHDSVDDERLVYAPFNQNLCIGSVREASLDDVEQALSKSTQACLSFEKTSVNIRADYLRRFADLLETHHVSLLALLCMEAGKTWPDALAELREAVDFCRYYAAAAETLMQTPKRFQGYTGETNELSLHPRGVIVCISPWNFPLAIFVGQIVAALVTGNCVIAKPAEQTPLIAGVAIDLMRKSGFPAEVVQILPGRGETIGAALVADLRVKGVIFTGSTETATQINQTLANRSGEIVPFIAETGGQNAMIVDSSALLEQVIMDVFASAFGSAGQRCSALRVLFIQDDVFDRFIHLLTGAMAELTISDPRWLSTDIGPVIDQAALTLIKQHVAAMKKNHTLIYECILDESTQLGFFIAPTVFLIEDISALKHEIFGPILHVIRYQADDLDNVIHQIKSTQYGLTLGIHSRIQHTIDYIRERIPVGNCYVNRNMIGAVVGLQPFGGEGLSGTGPKAGGPYYLQRLCHERTYTINTTAAGGNASLMTRLEDSV